MAQAPMPSGVICRSLCPNLLLRMNSHPIAALRRIVDSCWKILWQIELPKPKTAVAGANGKRANVSFRRREMHDGPRGRRLRAFTNVQHRRRRPGLQRDIE